jgi:cytochrome P450
MIVIGKANAQPDGLQHETLLSKLHEALEASGRDHLSIEEVEDQMLTMIFAGYETTAAALGFAWYSLAMNPKFGKRSTTNSIPL